MESSSTQTEKGHKRTPSRVFFFPRRGLSNPPASWPPNLLLGLLEGVKSGFAVLKQCLGNSLSLSLSLFPSPSACARTRALPLCAVASRQAICMRLGPSGPSRNSEPPLWQQSGRPLLRPLDPLSNMSNMLPDCATPRNPAWRCIQAAERRPRRSTCAAHLWRSYPAPSTHILQDCAEPWTLGASLHVSGWPYTASVCVF